MTRIKMADMEEMTNRAEDLLNDLIKVNSERIALYEKAARETSDPELKTMFTNIANESKKFKDELLSEMTRDESPESETAGNKTADDLTPQNT